MTRSRGVQRFSLARLVGFRSTLVPAFPFFGGLSDHFHAFWPSEDLFWHAGKKQKMQQTDSWHSSKACISGYFGGAEKAKHLQKQSRVLLSMLQCDFMKVSFDPHGRWTYISGVSEVMKHGSSRWALSFILMTDKRNLGELRLCSHKEVTGSIAHWSKVIAAAAA